MKLGIVFPQDLEDPAAARDFAQGIEELGFDHINFPDHVIGANPATHQLNGPYTHKSYFHEPMTAMAYVAAITRRIELVPTVIILPQRQVALFAKQAAEVDVLSGGRLRVGLGVGWNQVEYEVLGMEFNNRGKRIDEQIEVLRRLWSEELVNFRGEWHHIVDAGINPRPLRERIPLWFGGWSDPMIERIARKGDGWLLYVPLNEGAGHIAKLQAACAKIGRDPREIGIQAWVFLNKSDVMAGANQKPGAHELRTPEEWIAEAKGWQELGASHLDCWTMYGGLSKADEHLAQAEKFITTMRQIGL